MFSKYFKALIKDKELIRNCMHLAIPLMLQALVVNSVTLVDNLMVGELGDLALSGISSANRYYMVMTYSTLGITGACVIFLAQFAGANNIPKMKESFRISLVLSLLMSFIFVSIAMFFPRNIVAFIVNDAKVIEIGAAYLSICCLSYIPTIISSCISQAMRAVGEAKIPMFISMFSVLVNVILDYLLILGRFNFPALGVRGAAIATLVARVLEMLIYLYTLKRNDFAFKTKITKIFSFELKLAKNILIKGLPLIFNETMWSFGMAFLVKCYSSRGVLVNTAYTMSATVSDLFFVLFSGMATATSVLVGTPLGANDLEKGRDNAYKLIIFSCLLSLVFALMLFGASFMMPLLYRNVSDEALALSSSFMKVMALFFILYMFNTQCYFTLRAGGDTRSTMFLDSFFMWLFNIPLVYFLAYLTDINVLLVYIIGQSTDLLKAFLSISLVRKEKWVSNLTVENSA